tara:strand:+ start:1948 stop:2370 length:423 start_codon:yes stop_codon:yes gene_type:complete
MELKDEQKLLKQYPDWAKKIRRVIVNLYRPILHDRSESKFNQHTIAYIMLIAFSWTAILVGLDSELYHIPFLSAFCVIPTTWIYLKYFPLTWDEMYDYEKVQFRLLWKKRKNWRPKPPKKEKPAKIGSEGRFNGKRHSTK